MIALCLLIKVPILVLFKTVTINGVYRICYYDPELKDPAVRIGLTLYDMLPSQIIPCFSILILNILIGLGINRSVNQVKVTSEEQGKRRKREMRCIANLLAVSTVFFIFTTPQTILWLYNNIIKGIPSLRALYSWEYLQMLYLVARFSDSLTLGNYCLNFIIYGVSLNYYRDTIKRWFTCKKYYNQNEAQQAN